LTLVFRVGVAGDRDRDEEHAARAYFDEHDRWPDESAPAITTVPVLGHLPARLMLPAP
jgi:hypothetical protein